MLIYVGDDIGVRSLETCQVFSLWDFAMFDGPVLSTLSIQPAWIVRVFLAY